MKDNFFKFPSTPHLATIAGVDIRGDKVLSESERDEFLQHHLVIEEKVDGANLGISFNSEGNIQAQNRGAYLHLPRTGQWKKLGNWLTPRIDTLFEQPSDRYILFGEWCYAQHSVFYDRLPDWFLGFDIYDKQSGRFLSEGGVTHFSRKYVLPRYQLSHADVLRTKKSGSCCPSQNSPTSLRKESIFGLIRMTGWCSGPSWYTRCLSSRWSSIGLDQSSSQTVCAWMPK
ncbi:RNA ligase family protein [Nitrosomonas mobilis]|uniref:RNA ligase family protein n=1 Tax=Nitrosomonas mobilis TaxID=51642 RepID=UPI000AF3D0B5|nr:RNA ligase family protein [Nitrosomonas mobilis]HNO75924.1 RNA ligase family protein [Nitrosomonas mobilis]